MAFDWWLARLLRIFGACMMTWEVLADRIRNPLVLLAGLMLATTRDIVTIGKGLAELARAEKESFEAAMENQDGGDTDSSSSPPSHSS